ncbi:MAG: Cas9 inhibitor AcrIIA9 family protein [Clostridium sp.]
MSIQGASIKINNEMQKEKNPYVEVIGSFLLKEIIKNKDAAEMVANSDKTIMGSLEAMRKVAAEKKTENYAILTDDEGFNIVCDYYGFENGIIESRTYEVTKEVKTECKVIELSQKVLKKETKKVKKNDTVPGQVSLFEF